MKLITDYALKYVEPNGVNKVCLKYHLSALLFLAQRFCPMVHPYPGQQMFISSRQTECFESLPDIDLVNVFNIDIAGPQNMDPRNNFIYQLPTLAKDFHLKVWIST